MFGQVCQHKIKFHNYSFIIFSDHIVLAFKLYQTILNYNITIVFKLYQTILNYTLHSPLSYRNAITTGR